MDARDGVGPLDHLERGEGRGEGGAPKKKEPLKTRARPRAAAPRARGRPESGVAVGDGLGVADDVGRGAEVLARAAQVNDSPRACRPSRTVPRRVAGAHAQRRIRRGPGPVGGRRGRHDECDLAGSAARRRQPLVLLPRQLEEVFAVMRGHAGSAGISRRPRPVLAPYRPRAAGRCGRAPRPPPARRVRPVLAEHPSPRARGRHQPLGRARPAGTGRGRQSPPASCSATRLPSWDAVARTIGP